MSTQRQREHSKARNMVLWSDQVCEDGINYSKAAAAKAATKIISASSVWRAPIHAKVLHDRHSWALPPQDECVASRDQEPLPKNLYLPEKKDVWKELHNIIGRSSPDWHSPGAERLNEHLLDVPLFHTAHRFARHECYQHCWLSALLHGHEILVRDKSERVCKGKYMFPLVAGGSSTFIGWPAEEVGRLFPYNSYQPAVVSDEVVKGNLDWCCLFIQDLSDWEAIPYTWWSPAHSKGAGLEGPAGQVQAYQSGPPVPLHNLAARNAFWSIPAHPALHKLAQHLEITLEDGASEFDIVFTLVKEILGLCEDAALHVCRLRPFFVERDRNMDNLMKADAALELLNKDDQKQVLKQQKDSSQRKKLVGEFKRALREKRDKVLRTSAPARHERKLLLQCIKKSKYPRLIAEGPLTQGEAKALLPPDTYIWRGRRQCAWCGHHPAAKHYASRSWSFGHRESAFFVIRELWLSWLDWHSLSHDRCPHPALLVEDD